MQVLFREKINCIGDQVAGSTASNSALTVQLECFDLLVHIELLLFSIFGVTSIQIALVYRPFVT